MGIKCKLYVFVLVYTLYREIIYKNEFDGFLDFRFSIWRGKSRHPVLLLPKL